MKFLSLAVGLTIGNFLYQLVTKKDWKKATSNSYYMSFGVLMSYLITVND